MEGGAIAFHAADHCFYLTGSEGYQYPGPNGWEGMHSATEQGDRIGMLLDLGQGSMTVWKNDEKLGAMQAEGLSAPLCWAVSLAQGSTARIESAEAPASPTEEELAAAKAWQDPDEFSESESDDEL